MCRLTLLYLLKGPSFILIKNSEHLLAGSTPSCLRVLKRAGSQTWQQVGSSGGMKGKEVVQDNAQVSELGNRTEGVWL